MPEISDEISRVQPVLPVASIQGEGPRTPPDKGKENKRPPLPPNYRNLRFRDLVKILM